jgi:hypothetical protein
VKSFENATLIIKKFNVLCDFFNFSTRICVFSLSLKESKYSKIEKKILSLENFVKAFICQKNFKTLLIFFQKEGKNTSFLSLTTAVILYPDN